MELGIKYRKAITLHSSPLSPSGPNLLNTLELAENALPCNASKTILQTSFPPQGLFYQMHDEENGKEKGKKDDVKHCPEVEKKVSPALRCPPWFFSYVKKGLVPSGVEQVIHHWVRDELRKKFVDTLFYAMSWIWTSFCLLLIRGEPHRGRHD